MSGSVGGEVTRSSEEANEELVFDEESVWGELSSRERKRKDSRILRVNERR